MTGHQFSVTTVPTLTSATLHFLLLSLSVSTILFKVQRAKAEFPMSSDDTHCNAATLQIMQCPKQLLPTHRSLLGTCYFLKSLLHSGIDHVSQENGSNLLKPTGHVMHQQFKIQQLYALPHTVFMCFVFI